MKVRKICKLLERAAYFDSLATVDSPIPRSSSSTLSPAIAARRADEFRRKAALLFVEGIKRQAGLADTNSKYVRAWSKRKHKNGPGSGNHGRTAKAVQRRARLAAEAAAAAEAEAAAAAEADEDESK